ncbi:hypothetical protein FEM48_Zijuj10G0061600 [Ziziphus jujuba var. spinosa]|uniref:B-like cyclin n=1 Tax=Ziziphus jujuba var. spinosa TaxID=714518 RepID=A0A978ULS0_ZIZJJ|nr:hypothetical protein FEM48_Zijuj10G0061600 [Ziziphus jujuba var. spinosa]
MSLSCSDCFSDLLCAEDSGILSRESPECSSDLESPACSEESIASFIEDERSFVPGFDYLARFRSHPLDASARAESVAWILKVKLIINRLHSLTCAAYLSVNYLDRFLDSRRLPQTNGWPLQLLSVACLSLAAKMEEPLVPSLLDLQVEGAKYIFEPRTIRRMELLVLGVLDWRLRSITPFSFIGYFACKLDSTGTFLGLKKKVYAIYYCPHAEASFLEYWPSCIAAAAILSAAGDIPDFSMVNPEKAQSWCDGLSKEKIISCYRLMKELVLENDQRKTPKFLPQLRVTIRTRIRSGDSSSSSSSSSSFKRRKLNNCLWVDDDKGNSE